MLLQPIKLLGNGREAFIDLRLVRDAQGDTGEKQGGMKSLELFLPFCGARGQRFVRFTLQLLLDPVDLMHDGPEFFDLTLVFSADDFSQDPIKHDSEGVWGGGGVAWLKNALVQGTSAGLTRAIPRSVIGRHDVASQPAAYPGGSHR